MKPEEKRRPEMNGNTIADVAETRACLIAAAPDLLQACKSLLLIAEGEGLRFDAMDDARDAIARAGGKLLTFR